jgi:hypothetical protein
VCTSRVTAVVNPPGTLADNGGGMQTLLPCAGSPAIDAGSDSDCNLSPVNGLDQRGVARPRGSRCDIGAVEMRGDLLLHNGLQQN